MPLFQNQGAEDTRSVTIRMPVSVKTFIADYARRQGLTPHAAAIKILSDAKAQQSG